MRKLYVLGPLVLLVCGGVLISGHPVSDASAAPTKPTDDAPAVCAAVQPPTITPGLYGSERYVYDIEGQTVTYVMPPAGLDLATAPNSEIEYFGFPPLPSDDPTAYALEEKELTASSGVPQLCVSDATAPAERRERRTKSASNPVEAAPSPNWAGVLDTPEAGETAFDQVSGDFYQTGYTSSACGSGAEETSWVGIGGYNSGSLIQAGTITTSPTGSPYPFCEYLDSQNQNSAVINTAHAFKPGDEITSTVYYDASDQQGSFGVYDVSTNTLDGIFVVSNLSAFYDGSTAEWIDERPEIEIGKNEYVTQFLKIADKNVLWEAVDGYNEAQFSDNTVQYAMQAGFQRVNMYDTAGNDPLLGGDATQVTNQQWYDNWYLCGTQTEVSN